MVRLLKVVCVGPKTVWVVAPPVNVTVLPAELNVGPFSVQSPLREIAPAAVLVPEPFTVAPLATSNVSPAPPPWLKPPVSNVPPSTRRLPVTFVEVIAALGVAPAPLVLFVCRLL